MPTDNKKRRSVAVLCCLAISFFLSAIPSFAASPDVVISQVYGGGGNTGAKLKSDYVELFNRGTSPVTITGWSLQYASKSSTGAVTNGAGTLHVLSGTIQPGQYFLVREAAGSGGVYDLPAADASGSIALSGTDGKIFLVNNSTPLTSTACPISNAAVVDFVGYGAANCAEGGAPTGALSSAYAAVRKSACADTDNNAADFRVWVAGPRNSSSPITDCTIPSGTGSATPSPLDAGATTLLTVWVTPGINPNSTGITVSADLSAIGGVLNQTLFDDGTHGDAVTGDSTYSFSYAIPGGTVANTYSLPVTISDEQARTSSTSIVLTVLAPAVRAAIHDIQGNGASSPFEGKEVIANGIVTSKTTSGFYLELPDAEHDADPATSEGIYIYTNSVPSVSVGDLADVTGWVSEYYSTTEIITPSITVLSTGNVLPTPVELTPDPHGAVDQVERYEGMLVKVSSPRVIAPTDGSNGTSNGVFFVTNGDVPRPFREPGVESGIALPSGMPANYPQFDGNPERIRVDSAACTPSFVVATGDTLPAMTGPLGYYSGDYTVYPCPYEANSTTAQVVPLPDRDADEFTVASFNMLNFTSDATRLAKASKAIREVLRTPDVIGVEEVNNLATLQALAAKIDADAETAGQAKPNYAAEMVATSGTQNIGFLYRSDRILDVSVTEIGRDVLMPDNTTKLNDRPPLVMTAKVTPLEGGEPFPVTIIVNHLRSLIDVDSLTSDYARTKRQLGAEYLANLIAQHQTAGEHVISVGDYNAFEFNDGYVDVLGTVTGKPTAPDQVLLASNDLVDPDLVDLITTLPAEKRYTYVENGSAQALDHVVVTPSLLTRPYHLEVAHLNADFPETLSTDGSRAERVSDHDVPVAYFTLPPVLAPQVKLSATSLDFGHVAAGSSARLLLQLTNEGTAALNITSISTDLLPTFSAGTPECGTTLDAGATCTIIVMFRPQSAESFTANLSIVSDAKGSPNVVTLSGVGVNTTAKAEPTSIDFGDQVINTEGTRIITVTNTGTEPMFVNRMEIQLPSVRNDGMKDCMGGLGAGESCQITVIFRPTQLGPVTGFVMVGGNFETLTVNLAGKGVEAPAPRLTVTPASLEFGGQTINGVSNSKTITVANSGTLELNISKIEISGEYTQSNNCPATLAAGADCIVSVNFAPKSTGTKSGTIMITHNATGSPTSVALNGSGTDFTVAVPASGSTSATVTPGQTATYDLQIAGTEGFNGPVTLTCTGAPAKTVCNVNPATVNAMGSTPAAFTVSVATVAPSTAEVVGSVGPLPGSGRGWPTLLAIGLAGIGMIVFVGRNRKLQWRLTGAFAAVVMVVGLSSCGGSSFKTKQVNVPGTAAGTYTLTVTATSGSVSHDVKLTLKVN